MAGNNLANYHKSDMPLTITNENIYAYLKKIREFPVLSPEEEYKLAKLYAEKHDLQAAHKLVTSHLRLVAKIAFKYKHYGLPVSDIISEGNIGLMKAVKKFEPKKGFRLATYAIWWIKATINEFILSSWSLVKVGTVAAQKKLFFKLRGLKEKLGITSNSDMSPDEVKQIAKALNVKDADVVAMNRRMGGDVSLNTKMNDEDKSEKLDFLADDGIDQEVLYSNNEEKKIQSKLLIEALSKLNNRERYILIERKIKDPPKILDDLANEFQISRERVRQIEEAAFAKIQDYMVKRKSSFK